MTMFPEADPQKEFPYRAYFTEDHFLYHIKETGKEDIAGWLEMFLAFGLKDIHFYGSPKNGISCDLFFEGGRTSQVVTINQLNNMVIYTVYDNFQLNAKAVSQREMFQLLLNELDDERATKWKKWIQNEELRIPRKLFRNYLLTAIEKQVAEEMEKSICFDRFKRTHFKQTRIEDEISWEVDMIVQGKKIKMEIHNWDKIYGIFSVLPKEKDEKTHQQLVMKEFLLPLVDKTIQPNWWEKEERAELLEQAFIRLVREQYMNSKEYRLIGSFNKENVHF